jgi:hypothetical protein
MPLWIVMDSDKSGRVDISEFRSCAERCLRWQFQEKDGVLFSPLLTFRGDETTHDKFISGMCEKIIAHLFGKKSFIAIDDLIKLAWLRATRADVKIMKAWCKEVAQNPGTVRVSAPPVLPEHENEGLVSVYHQYEAGNGHVSFETLVKAGLFHEYQIPQAKAAWDTDGSGTLDMQEFLDMMCPLGFRAEASSVRGSRRDGTRVRYDEMLTSWRVDKEMQAILSSGLASGRISY